jgi:hypothetical protein
MCPKEDLKWLYAMTSLSRNDDRLAVLLRHKEKETDSSNERA